MNLKDVKKEVFVPEYSQLMRDEIYLELIEKYKNKEKQIRKEVFAMYTQPWFTENQIYNEKNASVEIISILLDVVEDLKNVKAVWIKYLQETIESLIWDHTRDIENKIWGFTNINTMSVYTETDLMLRWANVYVDIYSYYERSLEWFKKVKEEPETEVQEQLQEEDNS